MVELNKFSEIELFTLYGKLLKELYTRKIIRTYNNPLGDYAEWLTSIKLNLQLMENSKSGYDAIDDVGTRYQIKSRRITEKNKSRQLSDFRNLPEKKFDYLIALLFDEEFKISVVAKIPYNIVVEFAKYTNHTNGHRLILHETILKDDRIEIITPLFLS